MEIPYYHVDSFSHVLFAGNPAGVCILPCPLTGRVLHQIAAENALSQTAFVTPQANGDFDLRWFTPKVEDDLCGHATLASAFVLSLRGHIAWPIRFHTRSGVLTVAREGDRYVMDFPAWLAEPCEPPAELLPALGIDAAQVMKARDYLVVVDQASAYVRSPPTFARWAD